ncbi:hypothetical protein OEW28_01560 [Defluviimonas sp. WL0002]|uniref:Outer membrane beta-barrel protein n=1 Tax=Albidovulum marisflavi TaxID=2984159 RepID=A0ABT2Z841_9RHOB|nr:hypothetical protein [Defluviimonas sp. WL0002]MCV2867313.1 hypothetical protein [Defluviimonas sp. WL0002]
MGNTGKRIAAAATIITLAPTFAAAQTGGGDGNPGGLQIDVGVSTGLTYDSNLSLDPGGDDASIWDTGLTFALSSVAANQRLDLVASGVLRYIDSGGDTDFGLEDTRLRFGYQRESLNSRLDLTASYSDVDRDFIDPFVDTSDSGSGGSVATTDLGLRYETGLQDPLGFWIDLSHNKVDYSDTTDPDLDDNRTDRAEIAARMNVSPVSTVTLSASERRYEEDVTPIQTDRTTTTTYLARLEHELDQVYTLDLGLGHARIEDEEAGLTTITSGLVGFVGATRAMTNGIATARLETALETEGRRSNLTFGREMELPTGTFAATIGASRAPNGDVDAIGSLAYVQRTRTGELTVILARTTYSDDEDNVIDTSASASYRHEINAVSRLDFGVAWSLVDRSSGGPEDETEFTRISAAYTRDLNADWDLTGGVTYRDRSDTDDGDADSTAVFVTLSRNYSFRP